MTKLLNTPIVQTMSTQLQVNPENIIDTVKRMLIDSKEQSDVSDSEMMMVLSTCAKYDLNPFVKQAYPVLFGGKLTMVIGIDGWFEIANRHPQYDGVEFEYTDNEDGTLNSCTAKIYRKDRSRPICITQWMEECQGSIKDSKGKLTSWGKKPRHRLTNKTFAECARVAFGISAGVPDDAMEFGNRAPEVDITDVSSVVPGSVESHSFDDDDKKYISDTALGLTDESEIKSFFGDVRAKMIEAGEWDEHKDFVISERTAAIERVQAVDIVPAVEPDIPSNVSEEKTVDGLHFDDDDIDIPL